jgi:hypothetical protein
MTRQSEHLNKWAHGTEGVQCAEDEAKPMHGCRGSGAELACVVACGSLRGSGVTGCGGIGAWPDDRTCQGAGAGSGRSFRGGAADRTRVDKTEQQDRCGRARGGLTTGLVGY